MPFAIQSKMLTSLTAFNMINILQGSVVTLTMLGGLTRYRKVANFLKYTPAKNYDGWLTVDKSYCNNN